MISAIALLIIGFCFGTLYSEVKESRNKEGHSSHNELEGGYKYAKIVAKLEGIQYSVNRLIYGFNPDVCDYRDKFEVMDDDIREVTIKIERVEYSVNGVMYEWNSDDKEVEVEK